MVSGSRWDILESRDKILGREGSSTSSDVGEEGVDGWLSSTGEEEEEEEEEEAKDRLDGNDTKFEVTSSQTKGVIYDSYKKTVSNISIYISFLWPT